MTNNWIINIGFNGKRIFECINLSVDDLFKIQNKNVQKLNQKYIEVMLNNFAHD